MRNLIVLLLLLTTFTGVYAQEDQDGNQAFVVIEIEGGEASVMYSTGVTSALTVGARIYPGDVIVPHGSASVTVLCPEKAEQSLVIDVIVQTRAVNCRIDSGMTIWLYGDREIVGFSQRNQPGNNPMLSIITPRNTNLLYGNPQFSWTPVPLARSYTLTIKLPDDTLIWEKTNIHETSIEYPADKLNLRAVNEAGQTLQYLVQVRAFDSSGNRISTTLDMLNDGFVVVAQPNERTRIEQELSNFERVSSAHTVSSGLVDYLKALYLYSEGYYADALQLLYPNIIFPLDQPIMLESITRNQIDQSPHLYKLLGDIFAASKLREPAFQSYSHALWLAEETQDLSVKADILLKLTSFGGSETAEYYEQARQIYEQLGNTERLDYIQQRLGSLSGT